MSIVLYYGSGSPYAWRVQLALEHKALAYERKVISFSAGDTRKPEFLALNPRHRVPVLVDGDFVLYESNAIVEYLDEAYPATGAPLFPGDVRTRALVRRLIMEVDNYFDDAIDPLTTQAFGKKPEERDPKEIAEGPPGRRRRDRAVHQGDARRVSRGPAVRRRLRALSGGRISEALRDEAARPRRRRHADARIQGVEGAHRGAAVSSRRPSRPTGNKAEERAMELSTSALCRQRCHPSRIRVRRDGRGDARETVGQPQSGFHVERAAGGHEVAGAFVPRPGRAVARRRRQPGRSDRAGHRCRASISSTGCWSTCRRTRRRSSAANSRTALPRAANRARMRRAERGRGSTITPAGSPATRTWPATTSATTARARPGTTSYPTTTSSRCTRSTCRGSRWRASSPARDVRKAMAGHVLGQAARDRPLHAESGGHAVARRASASRPSQAVRRARVASSALCVERQASRCRPAPPRASTPS